MNIPRIGVGVFIRRDNHILIGKRRGEHGGGYWQLAGGHLELGETPEACAEREVLEETGVVIENTKLLATTNDIFDDQSPLFLPLENLVKQNISPFDI